MSHITPRFRNDTAGAGRNSLWSEAILARADWCEKTVIQYLRYFSKRCRKDALCALCTSQRGGQPPWRRRLSQYQCISLQKGIMERGHIGRWGPALETHFQDLNHLLSISWPRFPCIRQLIYLNGLDHWLNKLWAAVGRMLWARIANAMGSVTFTSEGRKWGSVK